ncbi:MAG: DUF2848 domain-containing protein [Pseudomonadota bacterium]|nr:DUF2848 domain-containing protein [Pseudomonadota bacterium]
MQALRFEVDGGGVEVPVRQLVIAGWTGRDVAAVEHHIDELAAIGVARPSTTPLYYRVAHTLLTQSDEIDVLGSASSGECEPVLIRHQSQWWLTVGSDHTDRQLEAQSVALSKQLCAKPLARQAWRWNEVAARADDLELGSQIFEDGRWMQYQQGRLSQIRPLMSLVEGLSARQPVADGLVLFCGTLAALPNVNGEAVRPAERMKLMLHDTSAGRSIEHEYRVTVLQVVT